jgi:hypothetical protein
MRWLLLPLAFGIVVTAVYALLTGPVRLDRGAATPGVDQASRGWRDSGDSRESEHHGEIRQKSREQLREILRRADTEDRR